MYACEGYFVSQGYDGYHSQGARQHTKSVERINYVMKVATHKGALYVLSAFSNMALSTSDATGECDASKDALCSVALVRMLLGNVVTAMIKAPTEDALVSVFAGVTNKEYNHFYQDRYTGFYPFIWGMSGKGFAHGANPNNVGTYLNSSSRVQIPKLKTLHYDLRDAALKGGSYVGYSWNNPGEAPYLKVAFNVGVR
eukprot:4469146-Prymnesium_polylepis.1